jgi:hypothetical protein
MKDRKSHFGSPFHNQNAGAVTSNDEENKKKMSQIWGSYLRKVQTESNQRKKRN